jgi:phage tail sheath protein FI
MAERIVSPGVFTVEKDQSFLQAGVSEIGAAIVGPTVKGPALIPTQVTSFQEFENIFGSYSEETYVPFVVQDYLRNAGVITITRLLYEDGYQLDNGLLGIVATSASAEYVTHVLHPSRPISTVGAGNDIFETAVLDDAGSGSFSLKLSGSYAFDSNVTRADDFYVEGANISGSIVSSANSYLTKIIGADAKTNSHPAYVIYENTGASALFNNLGDVTIKLVKAATFEIEQDYQTAATPWITSQKISGNAKNLIKFHTLSHGTSTNHEVKVGIRDVRPASEVADPNGFGTFTVEVRRVNTNNITNSPYSSDDTDARPEIVESYTNVNLDPLSPRYVARVIGDQYQTTDANGKVFVNGDYPNISQYIRVEADAGVKDRTNDKTLIPFGFRSLSSPIPNISGSVNLEAASFVTSQTVSSQFSNKNYHGFDFTDTHNLNYIAPIPTTGATTGSNADFYLGDVSQASEAGFPSLATAYSGSLEDALTADTFTTNISINTRKFIVPLQGGFDGARPNLPKLTGGNITANNSFGFDCSGASTTGTTAYKKAFAALSNTDVYDINMLITPGIIHSLHPSVTAAARTLAEDRQDTFYVMDSNALTDSIATVTNTVNSIDSNYTATYYPWVRIIDTSRNIPIFVPPSVVVPGVLSFNDAVAAPWYAPAGLNRGGLTQAIDVYSRLTQAERDTLYQARTNPIATFPGQGICIWGQKTLQSRASALDRVNVRRLLITVKKFIASSTRYLVFEQNTAATRNRFANIVNPYLERVKQQQGLYAFRVIMDETNNTPDVIDQNILYGQLFLQPTRTAEFIVLDFNIQPTGASFPE